MKKLFQIVGFLAIVSVAKAQQPPTYAISLNTGIYDNLNTYIPVLSNDDNWEVLTPGASAFVPAMVSNGVTRYLFSYQKQFYEITPNAQIITSELALNTGPNAGDLIDATPGQYTYRRPFFFDGCQYQATQADFLCKILTGGYNIVDVRLNNTSVYSTCLASSKGVCYSQNGPQTFYCSTTSNSSLLEWDESRNMNNNYGQNAYFTTQISQYVATIMSPALNHGINYVYITVDVPANHNWVSGIIIDADLNIFTTSASGVAAVPSISSPFEVCPGDQPIIGINEAMNPTAFKYTILDPNAMFSSGTPLGLPDSYQTAPILGPTTYQITYYHNASGCPTTANVTIQTYGQLDFFGTPQTVCENQNQARIQWQFASYDNPSDYLITVQWGMSTVTLPPGSTSVGVPVPNMGLNSYIINVFHTPSGCYVGYTWDIYKNVGVCGDQGRMASNVTGLNTNEKLSVNIDPNPSSGAFRVSNLDGNSTITVTDMAGRKLFSTGITSNTANVDLSAYDSGIYFLTVEANGQRTVSKLIKN
jgi:hypothetical protein